MKAWICDFCGKVMTSEPFSGNDRMMDVKVEWGEAHFWNHKVHYEYCTICRECLQKIRDKAKEQEGEE